MKSLKPVFLSAVNAIPLSWLIRHSPLDVLIPFQHLVSDEPVPYMRSLYGFKNVKEFEADIDFLLRNFQPVSLTDIIEHRKNKRQFRKKSFLLTFDDGLRQVYDTVMPVLLRKGVPAALFVNPAFAMQKELFYDLKKGLILQELSVAAISSPLIFEIQKAAGMPLRSLQDVRRIVQSIQYGNKHLADTIGQLLQIDFQGFADRQKPFMNTDQIRTWISKGFQVGAHSIDHPLYKNISAAEQIRQTKESVNWVCNTFGISYRSFAFPHVDEGVSHAFFTAMLHGESEPLDIIFGNRTAMVEQDDLVLHRYNGENPRLHAESMVKAVLSYNLARTALKSAVIKRH